MATHAISQARRFLPARMVRQVARCQVQTGGGEAGASYDATLHDVSSFGCRVSGAIDVDVGERISLRLAGSAPVDAVVVWRDAGVIGCRFERRLDRKFARSLTLTCH